MREDRGEDGQRKGKRGLSVLGVKCDTSFLLDVLHPAVSKTHDKDLIIRASFSSTH